MGKCEEYRPNEAHVAVACESFIMRGAITSSLSQRGFNCINMKPSNASEKTPVAIVVAGLMRPTPGKSFKETEDLHGIDANEWIVLTREKDHPLCRAMISEGYKPRIIPEDIADEQLATMVKDIVRKSNGSASSKKDDTNHSGM